MHTFKNTCAQGDVYFRRIDALPEDGLTEVASENGVVIVTHSETGHHHVMAADTVTLYRKEGSLMDFFMTVKEPTELQHLRSYDTHEPILFDAGTYHVRRQREHTPEGFRMVQD